LGHAADEMCVKQNEREKDSIWDGAMSVGEVSIVLRKLFQI